MRHLIVNADDFGVARGVNQGIIECHQRGILTSASLMVERSATHEAVALSKENPQLAIGLHWDGGGEGKPYLDMEDPDLIRAEFERQLALFVRLMGCMPTHIDSESHAHREPDVMPIFMEYGQHLGVPVRCDGQVAFEGGFYAQWTHGLTEIERISLPVLEEMLRTAVQDGWTEFSCHPGYPTDDHRSLYWIERETEVQTLTDPGLRSLLEELDIQLCSYADFHSQQGGKHALGLEDAVTGLLLEAKELGDGSGKRGSRILVGEEDR